MEIVKLTPKRLLIKFPTRKEMTISMFRISEYKEGKPGIKGKHFDIDEFLDIYSDENGGIDYWSYWEGFNFSSKDLLNFRNHFQPNLTKRENEIIHLLSQVDEDGYIIAMVEGDDMTYRHELAHGIFFEDVHYRSRATEIVYSLNQDVLDKYFKELRTMDYPEEVLVDEAHAYLVAYDQDEWDECFPTIKLDEIIIQRDQLNELFDKTVMVEILNGNRDK
jgi:hypothetical protein